MLKSEALENCLGPPSVLKVSIGLVRVLSPPSASGSLWYLYALYQASTGKGRLDLSKLPLLGKIHHFALVYLFNPTCFPWTAS